MLFLLFQLGRDRYALDTKRIIEVLPLVQLKLIPQAPPAVAGLFACRGETVPVVDLCQLALGRPASHSLSTRIIVVDYGGDAVRDYRLGLMAEKVTETLRRQPREFTDAGVSVEGASYLGPVTNDGAGLIQRIEVDQLLTPEVHALLFQPVAVLS
jgi:chemotaxis-related protein WspB